MTVATRDRVDTRGEALDRLRAHAPAIVALGATALFLFGSAARDELTPESDIDLFIDYDPNSTFGFVELFRLRDVFEEMLGRKVDLTSRDGLHPRLRARIERSSMKVF